jgi:predicted Zn finger-like uncharacterized protein
MPITIACPQCHTALNVPDNLSGRQVKCPKCNTAFVVSAAPPAPALPAAVAAPAAARRPEPARVVDDRPRRSRDFDDDYDDRPRRPVPDASATGLQSGLGIAALVVGIVALIFGFVPCIGGIVAYPAGVVGLILGIVGLVVALNRNKLGLGFPIAGAAVSVAALIVTTLWLVVVAGIAKHSENVAKRWEDDVKQAGKNLQKGQDALKTGGKTLTLVDGRVEEHANITDQDPVDPRNPAVFGKRPHCKIYSVTFQNGRTYQIDMNRDGNGLDPYLRIINRTGVEIAHDDDGGEGFLNARITHLCTEAGTYRIIATTFDGGSGAFTLKIEEK